MNFVITVYHVLDNKVMISILTKLFYLKLDQPTR